MKTDIIMILTSIFLLIASAITGTAVFVMEGLTSSVGLVAFICAGLTALGAIINIVICFTDIAKKEHFLCDIIGGYEDD